MGYSLFEKSKPQQTHNNNILDNIKSEPTIKRLLRINKICNIIGYILDSGAALLVLIFQYLSLTDIAKSISAANKLLMSFLPAGVVLAIGITLSVVATVAKYKANKLIDEQLNKMARACGVLNKYPTSKDITKWKILYNASNALTPICLIAGFLLVRISNTAAIILLLSAIAFSFAAHFTTKKANNLQDERVKNIIYAEPPKPQEQNEVSYTTDENVDRADA